MALRQRAKRVNGSAYERFVAKFAVDSATGCWEWTASRDRYGYGLLWGTPSAHRFSYEHHIGPIPPDRQLHHTCENRGCVNSFHMIPVTHAEHQRLGARATKTHCVRGHLLSPDNLLQGRRWRNCKQCHRELMQRRRQEPRAA